MILVMHEMQQTLTQTLLQHVNVTKPTKNYLMHNNGNKKQHA
jgi:hypothetical protein